MHHTTDTETTQKCININAHKKMSKGYLNVYLVRMYVCIYVSMFQISTTFDILIDIH